MEMSRSRRLLPRADDVVRILLPRVLEADGLHVQAGDLRGLPELQDIGSVSFACGKLRRLFRSTGSHIFRLAEEAAISAVLGDAVKFRNFILQATEVLRLPGTPGLN